jgi:hypothetical protein
VIGFLGAGGGFLRGGNFRREANRAQALRTDHDSDRAALIYQHATRDADHRIADALDARVRTANLAPYGG